MTRKSIPFVPAVAAASLAVALAACAQTTPAAGGPAAAPGAPATPAADPQSGIVGDTIVIAIKADTDQSDQSTRRENVVQHGQRIDRTLSFPSDFTHSEVNSTHRWTHEFERSDITRQVLDRGGIVPWISLDGGETWLTAFSLPSWSITIGASVGKLSITIATLTFGQPKTLFIPAIQNELTNNTVMIRLFVLRATG